MANIKILFIGFWGLEDPLTLSTTFPNLKLLAEMDNVELIHFATVERDNTNIPALKLPFSTNKITHKPLVSRPQRSLLTTKFEEFLRFPRELAVAVRELEIDIIIGRGAMAGALAYLTSQRTGKPFYVESFEPHADYMLDAGVWGRYDPRYIFQRFWEGKEKKYAKGLMPVAENYRKQLQIEGVPASKIITMPCPVDTTAFRLEVEAGQAMRRKLKFGLEDTIGIYVGKFGGIYYDAEAFDLFRAAAEYFGPSFRLIILTPNSEQEVRAKLLRVGINAEQCFVGKVPHHEVPKYLAAADFAFGLHLPTPFVSPVKVGEYWASGLPVLLTDGVGDDSDIIKAEGGGAIFNLRYPESVPAALNEIKRQISQANYREPIQRLAVRHRSIELSRQAYEYFFSPNTVH
jgi:glycosyltransferase involved in cell wall biosynthesis